MATVSADAGLRLPPAGISSRAVAEPSQPRSQARRPGPSSGDLLRTMAAAPSPKMTTVPRSSGSTTRESVSDPTTSTWSRLPLVNIDAPTTSSYTKPAQPALRSNEPHWIPRPSLTKAPVWGMSCSGVAVATISRSMASGVSPACLIAAAPASVARLAVVAPSTAMRRSRMPVRSTIHWSLVSTRCSRSALVRTCSGSAVPHPAIAARIVS